MTAKEKNKPATALDHDEHTFIQITVRGTVKRKIRNGNALQFTVQAANNSNIKSKAEYPTFFIYQDLNRYDKLFSVDDRVTVVATMRTSKKYRDGYFIAESVTLEDNDLDIAFSDEAFMTNISQNSDMNQWRAIGVVSRPPFSPPPIAGRSDVCILSVRVEDGAGYPSYLRVVCFGKTAAMARRKKDGDPIQCVGYIQTKSISDENGKSRNSDSLICTNLR